MQFHMLPVSLLLHTLSRMLPVSLLLRTLFRMLPVSLPVCPMLRTLFRMLPVSLLLRMPFHTLHLTAGFRLRSNLQCLLMPCSLPPVLLVLQGSALLHI